MCGVYHEAKYCSYWFFPMNSRFENCNAFLSLSIGSIAILSVNIPDLEYLVEVILNCVLIRI